MTDAPVGFERKRPEQVLDEIDRALAEHAASLLPRTIPVTFSDTTRARPV